MHLCNLGGWLLLAHFEYEPSHLKHHHDSSLISCQTSFVFSDTSVDGSIQHPDVDMPHIVWQPDICRSETDFGG